MHEHFQDWYREIQFPVVGNKLQLRWDAIEEIAKPIAGVDDSSLDLVKIYLGLDPNNPSRRDELASTIMKHDPEFINRRNSREIRLISGVVIAHIIDSNIDHLSTTLSLAISCGSFQGIKKVPFKDGLNIARRHLRKESQKLRDWTSIDNTSRPDLAIPKELSDAIDQNDFTVYGGILLKTLNLLAKRLTEISSELQSTKRRVILQQEEIDILWWMINKRSKNLQKPFNELGVYLASILIPNELAEATQVSPGPYSAKAFLDSMLDTFPSEEMRKITLRKIVNEISREWNNARLESTYKDALLPLSFAISSALEQDDGDWIGEFEEATNMKANRQFALSLISYQFYQERLLQRAIA